MSSNDRLPAPSELGGNEAVKGETPTSRSKRKTNAK